MAEIDAVIGQNIALFRGEQSQSDLALRMKEKGIKWSQTTVWEVEKGKRALKFSEALVLAEVLEISLERLTNTSRGFVLFKKGGDLWEERNKCVRQIMSSFKEFQIVQQKLSSVGRSIKREAEEDNSVEDIKEYGDRFIKLGMASLVQVAGEVADEDRRKLDLDSRRLPDDLMSATRELRGLEDESWPR